MEKLLFTELRILKSGDTIKGRYNVDLEKALVDNENLIALGYSLKGEDIMELAAHYAEKPNMTPLYKKVKEFEPDVQADPMYPNFPIQVLEMSELEFRAHQLVHYLTTYGFEDIYGIEVAKGWLPETGEVMERTEDVQVVDLKVVDLMDSYEINQYVIDNLIQRKERLLRNELEIVKNVVKDDNRSVIKDIPFKENIGAIYGDTLLNATDVAVRDRALLELKEILKHPGDVLDLIEALVRLNKYKHFKTSLKRGLVNLLESYSTASIEENLASNRWSNSFLGRGGKRRAINRNIALIDYLSYSKFSKNAEAMKLVNELRDGELLSWNQKLERAYEDKNYNKVLEMLLQRPGVYFRQINRLHKLGVPVNVISSHMKEVGPELKTQSIISALNNFDGDGEVHKVFYDALISNLSSKEIESIAGKKIFIEDSDVDLSKSHIEISDKFEDGGYLTNGIALKLPENAEFLRFFTYWDSTSRIDIDLHAAYKIETGDGLIGRIGHIGWNGSFNLDGLTYSGDITHPGSAEYIDIDLQKAIDSGVDTVQFNINSYTTVPFKDIETLFTGVMALSSVGQEVELYDQKNVMFRHDLKNSAMATDYGQLDLKNGVFRIIGKNANRHNDENILEIDSKLPISSYLNILFATQGSTQVSNKEDADLIVGLAKSDEDNYLSLIDENYFI